VARVIIADDHEMARAGLRAMLADERALLLIGEATNGREALELCEELRPDLALLDVRMPEMDGLTATRAIRQACPQTQVLMVTTHEEPAYLLTALRAGASGYVLKDVTRQELLRTIRRVLRGEAVVSNDLATRALHDLAEQPRLAPVVQLAPFERTILVQIAEGRTNRQIGQTLAISEGVVKNHVKHLCAKLGVTDRTQAVVRATERGLLHAGDGGGAGTR
jgi:DNA-binding NarL/FixJ family response regulator